VNSYPIRWLATFPRNIRNYMRAMNANTNEIATNWLPSVKALGELNVGIVSYRAALRAHLLAETVEEKEAVEKTLEKIVESNDKIRRAMKP
jgi:methyl-accepting chemotaxis protein